MKKFLPLLLTLMATIMCKTALFAAPVDPTRAIQIAEQFMPAEQVTPVPGKAQAPAQSTPEIVYTHHMPNSGRPAIYVVNINGGFALVSADDVAHPVLGYNYGKPWPIADSLPAQLTVFLDDLATQMENSDGIQNTHIAKEWKEPSKAKRRIRTGNLPDSVGPLLTTTWDQGQYYNAMCPTDGQSQYDGRVVTGCVATAMAQIIKYWGDRETIHPRGIHRYESTYGILETDFNATSYDFSHMPNALTSASTSEEVNAVAKLISECGIAVNMQYSPTGSGAYDFDARAALVNFFRFNPNIGLAEHLYLSEEEWMRLLRADIATGKPILYSGKSFWGGHSFVCDGYQKDGFFHFNFGWSGNSDGWYLTNATLEYTSGQVAIIDIAPANTGNIIIGQMFGNSTFEVDEPMEFYHARGHNASYQGANYTNTCNNTITFISTDETKQLVVDIMAYKKQNVSIYDGSNTNTLLRSLEENNTKNDVSPIITSQDTVTIVYSGNLNCTGFQLGISQKGECRQVSNIVTTVDTTTVHLQWRENGHATQWQIEYGSKGFAHGDGTSMIVSDTIVQIDGLTAFKEYDFYIRPLCDHVENGLWSAPYTVMAMAPYWTDVVLSQPEGYSEDENGNITISSAEGLAWLAYLSNWSTTNQQPTDFEGRTVTITADIDLGNYLWKSIGTFKGILDGQGHRINNMHAINDNFAMFINRIVSATVKNILLTNCYVKQTSRNQSASALIGSAEGDALQPSIIMNCLVTGRLESNEGWMAPICEAAAHTQIINSATNCEIIGGSNMVGGMVADGLNGGGHIVFRNCYSASSISSSASWQGSILAYGEYCTAEYCYGYVPRNGGLPLVCGPRGSYRDLSRFDKSDAGYYLVDSMYFEHDNNKYLELKEVLNAGVRNYNIDGLRLWVDDVDGINDGIPVLGPEYVITCPNVQNVTISNITGNNGEYGVQLSWDATGDATMWEIKYHLQDSVNETHSYTHNNPETIWGLTERNTYLFSIRPICSETDKGGWCDEITHIFKRPYWHEIVTSKPDGFVELNNGNILLSTAEGLAWLSSIVNGLNGQTAHDLSGKTVFLINDINIEQYSWKPLSDFKGTFDGCNHIISGLSVFELSDYQGLFAQANNGQFQNLTIIDATIRGNKYVGILAGQIQNSTITNCHVSGTVQGEGSIGGLIGTCYSCNLNACSSTGSILANFDGCGGLCGYINGNEGNFVRNCYSQCDMSGGRYSIGGLFGNCNILLQNCYAIGTINGGSYKGGIAGGISYRNLDNCYFGGKVLSSLGGYSGAISGTTVGTPAFTNCYALYVNPFVLVGKSDDNKTPTISNSSAFVQEDDHFALMGTVTVGQESYTDLLSALNAWVNANNTNHLYCYWAEDTANTNKGFPVFAAVPKYTVTFQNYDGTLLQNDTLEAGYIPAYRGETPTRPGTAQTTYTFAGWTPTLAPVSEDVVYTALFDSTATLYTISANAVNGYVSGVGTYGYGSSARLIAIPDANYQFAQWSDGIKDNPRTVVVTKDITLSAEFEVIPCLVTSGECGDNVRWYITCDSVLIINGEGAIPNYSTSSDKRAPWYNYQNDFYKVVISEGISSIGRSAFRNMPNITEFHLASTVQQINTNVFTGTYNIQNPIYNSHLFVYLPRQYSGEYVMPEGIETIEVSAFAECYDLSSVVVSEGVQRIRNNAFQYAGVEHISLPNSLKYIENNVFYVCSRLKSINIPANVLSIGTPLFYYCDSLESISVDPDNTVYDSRNNCNALIETQTNKLIGLCRNTIIPSTVTVIGTYASRDYNAPAFIDLPESIEKIEQYAFYSSGIQHVTIPANIQNIESRAFYSCQNLMDVTFAGDVPPIMNKYNNYSYGSSFVNTPCNFYVPCGTKETYFMALNDALESNYASQLIDEARVQEKIPFSYTVSVLNPAHGQVNVIYEPTCDTFNLVLFAEAYEGYRFLQWIDGNTENPRNIPMTQDTTLIAEFINTDIFDPEHPNNPGNYKLTVTSSDETMGNVSGSGLYEQGSVAHIEAIANNGYGFLRWSDDDSTAIRDIVITRDCTLVASFVRRTFTIRFVNYNDEVLQSTDELFGTIPSYNGETPSRPASERYEYIFAGWYPDVATVTQDMTYTAIYDSVFLGQDTVYVFGQRDITELPVGKKSHIIVSSHGELTVSEETAIHYLTIEKDTASGQVHNMDLLSSEIIDIVQRFTANTDHLTQRWFAFAVPFEVSVATGIKTASANRAAVYENEFVLDEYDGALRADTQDGWKRVPVSATLYPGKLYMLASPNSTQWRFTAANPSAVSESWNVQLQEYPSSFGNHHAGWNGIANPSFAKAYAYAPNIQYATAYDNYYGVYKVVSLTNYPLWHSAEPFFVQTMDDDIVRFAPDGAMITGGDDPIDPLGDAPRYRTPKQTILPVTIQLSNADYTDKAYVTAVEYKEATYTIGQDLEKMQVNNPSVPQIWINAYGMRLAANAVQLESNDAKLSMGIQVPSDGTYTLSTDNTPDNVTVYLTQNGRIIYNLSYHTYSIQLSEGVDNEYGLLIHYSPQSGSGIDGTSVVVNTQKILRNGQLFILRGDKTYTVTGQEVK